MTTLSGRRVLIVEDESLIAMLAEDFLIELGVTVVGPATTIDGAIAMIETQEIDAAVLDLNIRGERSDRVADALRLRGIPIVCATGMDRSPPDSIRHRRHRQQCQDTS